MVKNTIKLCFMTLMFYMSLTKAAFQAAVNLTDADFLNGKVMDAESNVTGVWFVEFYAPWCSHCKDLSPIWDDLANQVQDGEVKIGKVDCTVNEDACKRVTITGYPTLQVLDSTGAYQFEIPRNMEPMKAFLLNETYKESGLKSEIKKDADIEKSSELDKFYRHQVKPAVASLHEQISQAVGPLYKTTTAGIESMFEAVGYGSIDFTIQIGIVIGVSSLFIVLVAYALCCRGKEREDLSEKQKQQFKQAQKPNGKKND
jgi:thioredoxin domain-containing protein 5